MLFELSERLTGPHKFDVFTPNSVNFGILVTYNQAWRPLNFQVGDLVKTIPLAPGESREYSVKRVEKKSRNQKEVEENLRIKKDENETKGRVESEIANKAARKTNWKLSAEASVSVGVFSGSASASIDSSSESSSEATKKEAREATKKAASEHKQENKLEIETKVSSEFETTETAKISNPNQEITVTYLFYELQRRFAISEKIHSVQPVVLVANDMPAPHEIDEDWILAHDWIIRRALLDDQFMPALNYLAESATGDEFRLEVLRRSMAALGAALVQAGKEITQYDAPIQQAKEDLRNTIQYLVRLTKEDEEDAAKATRIRESMYREQLEQLERELTAAKAEVARLSTEFTDAAERYADTLEHHLNMRTEITRLRIHIASNILHYMQVIWDTEHPDQRFFRLYNIKTPTITGPSTGERAVTCERDPLTDTWVCRTTLPPPRSLSPEDEWPTLGEVADLNSPLGYKGNYTIFPLKHGNYLTDYMAFSYVDDSGLGVGDPSGDATLDDLMRYFRCIADKYKDVGLPDEVDTEMRRILLDRLVDPGKDEEEIVVPTDSLYIEALPGTHPVLEDFKLMHRMMDVKNVAAEVRHQELENTRLVERLNISELEDPDVDRKVMIDGATVLSLTSSGDSDGSG